MGPANARKAIDHLDGERLRVHVAEDLHRPAAGGGGLAQAQRAAAQRWRIRSGRGRDRCTLAREWYRPHFERIYEHFHTRLGDLDQLELLSGQYPSRERFLTELTLDPPNATSDLAGKPTLDEDYLTLSTIHSAKGMEWDAVYVLNVVDGSFPSEFSTGKPELIEEERRLLYVGLTRAQNDLHADGAPEVPSHEPVAAGGCARVWRPQPLPDREGAEEAGGDVSGHIPTGTAPRTSGGDLD